MCAFASLLQFDFLTEQCMLHVPFVLHTTSAFNLTSRGCMIAAWMLPVFALRPGATPGCPVFLEFSLQAYAG